MCTGEKAQNNGESVIVVVCSGLNNALRCMTFYARAHAARVLFGGLRAHAIRTAQGVGFLLVDGFSEHIHFFFLFLYDFKNVWIQDSSRVTSATSFTPRLNNPSDVFRTWGKSFESTFNYIQKRAGDVGDRTRSFSVRANTLCPHAYT